MLVKTSTAGKQPLEIAKQIAAGLTLKFITDPAGQLTRRAHVMGNWSRFVRPGARRVAAPAAPQAYLYVTAFIDPTSRQVAVVAVNTAGYELDQRFTIAGGTVGEVTPWLTSESAALQSQPAVPVVDGGFTVTLPARSVTTFVGTAAL